MSDLRCCVDPRLVRQAQVLVEDLRRRNLTVVTAESCTGGLIAALLSHVSGASECLHGGFVVYTKANKATALGVSRTLLDREGSVNAQVAEQLARGALERSPAQLALAVTGVLGPEPDEDGNPPGEIYFAVSRKGRATLQVKEWFTQSDPDEVRRAVILRGLALLHESISESRS